MWIKKGIIFDPAAHVTDLFKTHACVPTPLLINDDVIRIFHAPRNAAGQSIPTYFDVRADDPSQILYVHNEAILPLGEIGTFDDGGIMPCSAVRVSSDIIYLYYVGWNPSVSVPYRNAIGLAYSQDNGKTFKKMFRGSVADRTKEEPFFTASPCVMKEGNNWHLWYASATGFIDTGDKNYSPLYEIKYGHSPDGINWIRENITCIPPAKEYECTARPTVIKEDSIYKMWFTFRGSFDYRDGADAYRIGYAESNDAVHWQRMDERAGISPSASGWDSTMQTYPAVLITDEEKYLFYNGNGFGATGIGLAIFQK